MAATDTDTASHAKSPALRKGRQAVAAHALSERGLLDVQRTARDTWVVALTGEGAAWAHIHLLGRRR